MARAHMCCTSLLRHGARLAALEARSVVLRLTAHLLTRMQHLQLHHLIGHLRSPCTVPLTDAYLADVKHSVVLFTDAIACQYLVFRAEILDDSNKRNHGTGVAHACSSTMQHFCFACIGADSTHLHQTSLCSVTAFLENTPKSMCAWPGASRQKH